MPYLVAAIVLLGAVCTVNLILTLALIRRLREQAGGPPGPRQPLPKVIVGIGERPAEFTAATTEGEPIDRDAVAGGLVGFFSPQCSPCRGAGRKRLPISPTPSTASPASWSSRSTARCPPRSRWAGCRPCACWTRRVLSSRPAPAWSRSRLRLSRRRDREARRARRP